jgi:hypothetical protein
MTFLVYQQTDTGENILPHSFLLSVIPNTPPHFHSNDRHQHHLTSFHSPSSWPNQSRNIQLGTHIQLLWGFFMHIASI